MPSSQDKANFPVVLQEASHPGRRRGRSLYPRDSRKWQRSRHRISSGSSSAKHTLASGIFSQKLNSWVVVVVGGDIVEYLS